MEGNWLRHGPYRMTVLVLWSHAVLLAILISLHLQGWINLLLPGSMLVLTGVGLIAANLVYHLLYTTPRCSLMLDRERRALAALRQHLDTDRQGGTAHDRVVALFGERVPELDDGTVLARFLRRLALSKASNPRYPLDLGSFSALLESQLKRRTSEVSLAASYQPRYGLFFTFLGVSVGLGTVDFSTIVGESGGADVAAGLIVAGQVLSGIGMAVLTSLAGMAGNIILSRHQDAFDRAVGGMVDEVEVLMLTRVLPLVNDEAEMALIREDMPASAQDIDASRLAPAPA